MDPIRLSPCALRDVCGGCESMDRHESEQTLSKRRAVEALLKRYVDQIHRSPRAAGYRARITMKVNEEGRLGYHRPRSHTWVHIPVCAIARPEINEVLAALPKLPPDLPAIELRSDGKRVVLDARTTRPRGQPKTSDKVKKSLKASFARLDATALGLAGISFDGQPLSGDSTLSLEVSGVVHQISPASFYQVNLEVNELLVRRVMELVVDSEPTTVLDLYAGIGNLSLPLAARGIETLLIEQAPSAVADAQATIAKHQLKARMICGDAGRFRAGDAFFDVVLLDPPRGGARRLIPELLTTRPKMVVYVSCNPATLARDIRPALSAGYKITQLELIDMFPQTEHIEVLCVLGRG